MTAHSPMTIRVQGDGVAARCAAYLLQKSGHRVQITPAQRSRIPVILLSEAALKLLRDVFDDPHLLRRAPAIRRRAVTWGKDASPVILEHAAVVVSEEMLLDSIRDKINADECRAEDYSWNVMSAKPLPDGAVEHCFGSRSAFAAAVHLADGSDAECCWIESAPDGWLFLIPDGAGSGWLLSVGAKPEHLIASSRVIGRQIAAIVGAGREFPTSPRITAPLIGDDWLACGSAAVSFDPICGDGTAYAAREAILAAAIIQAAAEGARRHDLLSHYESRVVLGFARHLGLCRELYGSGYGGSWWTSQAESIHTGLRWSEERLRAYSRAKFRLDGFRLTSVA